jgi:hypothetical protein
MGSHWKRSEVDILVTTCSAGNLTYEQIAGVLPGRTPAAVQQMALKLGFSTKNGRPHSDSPRVTTTAACQAVAEDIFQAATDLIDTAEHVRMCCGDGAADAVGQRGQAVGELALQLI